MPEHISVWTLIVVTLSNMVGNYISIRLGKLPRQSLWYCHSTAIVVTGSSILATVVNEAIKGAHK
jgi:hypothetical protein